MVLTARPQTKLAAALLTAGLVATAPVMVGTWAESLPIVSNVAVQPASVITDTLLSLAEVVDAVANTVMIGTDLALGLNFSWDDADFGIGVPINPVFLAVAAAQNPGSALSYVVQLYLNPSDNYLAVAHYTYPWFMKEVVVESVIRRLPSPLRSALLDAVNGAADSINEALSGLPDATAAWLSVSQQYNTPAGRLIYAVQNAIALPVTLTTALVYYVGRLPASLEATVESALQDPAEIPGLLSNLVHRALDPDLFEGLLGNLSYNLLKPLMFLPAPIGETSYGAHDGFAYSVYQGLSNAANGFLSMLPAPIEPTPWVPFAAAAASAAAGTSANSSADGTKGRTAESPNAHGRAQSGRKAVNGPSGNDRQQTSTKSTDAKKATGGSTGHGRSARGPAGSAA
jgi:hypothetical protein